jgi:hypothetical protein
MRVALSAIILSATLAFAGGCSSTTVRDVAAPGSATIGNLDSKWAPFAAYLQRAIDRVQRQWEREMIESRVPPPVGTVVTVVFWISPEGRVSRIEDVKSEPENVGAKWCVSAIAQKGTFGPWTEEMKTLLGPEEKMTFTFHYEDWPVKKSNKAPAPASGMVHL